MNPLEQRIIDLERRLNALESAASLPYDTSEAIRSRFNLNSFSTQKIISSSKVASSEGQTVNEGGSSIYTVMKLPDAFLEVVVGGATKYIPIFT